MKTNRNEAIAKTALDGCTCGDVFNLSDPSKMPCKSFSTHATDCQTGTKLRSVAGSTCANCYAMKGCYQFPSTQNAMDVRTSAVDCPRFVDHMVARLERLRNTEFRWKDSGDVGSLEELYKIVDVATRLPDINFWLPTREYGYVRDYLRQWGVFPRNLCVRLSAPMQDGRAPIIKDARGRALPTSEVHTGTKSTNPTAYACPAYKQDGHCNGAKHGGVDCRACWMPSVAPCVSYPLH